MGAKATPGPTWPFSAAIHTEIDIWGECLRGRKPHRNSFSVFDTAHDSIKVVTLHVNKEKELPLIALVGSGRIPAEGEDEREEAQLLYVWATHSTQRLLLGASRAGKVAARL